MDHELKHIRRHHNQSIWTQGIDRSFFESYRQNIIGIVIESSAHLVQDGFVDDG